MIDKHILLLNKVIEVQQKRDKTFYLFFKSLTPVMAGILGLLIGLKPKNIPDIQSKYLFLSSIILIGLCILSSVIVQFGEVSYYRKVEKTLKRKILNYMEINDESFLKPVNIKPLKFYNFFEYMTFVCLILSIISLIFYVYFLDFS